MAYRKSELFGQTHTHTTLTRVDTPARTNERRRSQSRQSQQQQRTKKATQKKSTANI